MPELLKGLQSPSKLRALPEATLPAVCAAIRTYLIAQLKTHGGHFASGLGVVELTVVLHYLFDTPHDLLIWDTGHQAYPHKVLTGRFSALASIRRFGGLHPFPEPKESVYDPCTVGHSGTSVSLGTGLAVAAARLGVPRKVVVVLGDGALGAGLVFEACNHLGGLQNNLLVIVNDNGFSIDPAAGALHEHDATLDFFKALHFSTHGPVDGHDVPLLLRTLRHLKEQPGAQVLLVRTQKGQGDASAVCDPVKHHMLPSAGQPPQVNTYATTFGAWTCAQAQRDPKLVVITPAMGSGSGLAEFARRFPEKFFDVGIAEQHALAFAAGLALGGLKPVVSIYSSFLQRAYDQLIHDIVLPRVPVILAVDRAGLVGEDGATHHGAFDLSFLTPLPDLVVMCPSSEAMLTAMLTLATQQPGPVAIRYPRCRVALDAVPPACPLPELLLGRSKVLRAGKNLALLNFGTLLPSAVVIAARCNATLVDMRFIHPLDEAQLIQLASTHTHWVTLEENVTLGGAGAKVAGCLQRLGLRPSLLMLGLPNAFVGHGEQAVLRESVGLSTEGLLQQVLAWLSLTSGQR